MLKMFKKMSYVFIVLFLTLCNFKVYAAEITSLEYNGFSDNRWATVHFATPTKDGGIVSISPVGPKEYGLNITNSSEEEKSKLRGAIRFFNGEKNNIPVVIEVEQEIKPCGQIYFNEEILQIFQEIVGNKIKIV